MHVYCQYFLIKQSTNTRYWILSLCMLPSVTFHCILSAFLPAADVVSLHKYRPPMAGPQCHSICYVLVQTTRHTSRHNYSLAIN